MTSSWNDIVGKYWQKRLYCEWIKKTEPYFVVNGGIVQLFEGGSVSGLNGEDVAVVVQTRKSFAGEVAQTFCVFGRLVDRCVRVGVVCGQQGRG